MVPIEPVVRCRTNNFEFFFSIERCHRHSNNRIELSEHRYFLHVNFHQSTAHNLISFLGRHTISRHECKRKIESNKSLRQWQKRITSTEHQMGWQEHKHTQTHTHRTHMWPRFASNEAERICGILLQPVKAKTNAEHGKNTGKIHVFGKYSGERKSCHRNRSCTFTFIEMFKR